MKLCAMNCHYKFYELEHYFEMVSKLGFKYCEIWTSPHHIKVTDSSVEDANKLKDLAFKFGVEIVCICPEQTNPKPYNIAEKDNKKQEQVFNYFKNIIDLAVITNANMVVITSGWAYLNENPNHAYERSFNMMKRLCRYAEENAVKLALEALQPEESILINNLQDLEDYKKMVDSDALKICLDMGAMARAHESIDDYFKKFGKDLVHIHFVDGNPTGHLAWGDGNRQLSKDIHDLRMNDYKGYLSLENATDRYFMDPQKADENSIKEYIKHGGNI